MVALHERSSSAAGGGKSWNAASSRRAVHDVVVLGLLRAAWERSPLARVPGQVGGTPPRAFVARVARVAR